MPLLPIVRSALAGLEQVPVATVTAARAMGMTPRQVLWHVELPLALPVLLIGLRTAVVQTTGLAAVTALVGQVVWAASCLMACSAQPTNW